jgi:hypothetical protein
VENKVRRFLNYAAIAGYDSMKARPVLASLLFFSKAMSEVATV